MTTSGIVTLPRAGTVEVIQQFSTGPSVQATPVLAPCIIGSSVQIETQQFAGYYTGKTIVLDESLGLGDGVRTAFQTALTPILTATLALHVGTIGGTLMILTTDYTVTSGGAITLTNAGVIKLGVAMLHGTYTGIPAQTYTYPLIKQGAVVQSPSTLVSVFLKTVEDIFDITNGFGVVKSPSLVTVPGNVTPFGPVTTNNGQILINSTVGGFTDLTLDFFALGVRPGDVLQFITNPSELQYVNSIAAADSQSHTILSITGQNTLTFSPNVLSQGGLVEYKIIRNGSQTGEILISYRANRVDLVGDLLSFETIADVESLIGPIDPTNPLAYAVASCLSATDKIVFAAMVADQDSVVSHQEALSFLGGENVYLLVPLTTNPAVAQIYTAHCETLSQPDQMHERRCIVTHKATEFDTFQAQSNTGSAILGSQVFTDVNAKFVTNGVPIGAVIDLIAPATIQIGGTPQSELIIGAILSETQVQLLAPVTFGTQVTGEAVGTGNGVQTVFNLAAVANVVPASVVIFFNGIQQPALNYVALPNGTVTFSVAPPNLAVITANYEVGTITGIQYTVESQTLTNFQIASEVAAFGEGFQSHRVTVTFADSVVDGNGATVEPFMMNAAIAGLVSTLPANQPIANMPIPGYVRVNHIRKFSETDFGVMAAGGISCFIQDRSTSPIVLRNWITCDSTNVNTRECSIVQAVDFFSIYLRNNVKAIAGKFNITPDFLDNMLRPAINGVVRELITAGIIGTGSNIISIQQSTLKKDQVFVVMQVQFFAPANVITITVQVL